MKKNGRRGPVRTREQSPSLRQAVKAAGGTTSGLALKIKLSPQAVSQWTKVPFGRINDVHDATGVPKKLMLRDALR
jgi:hypothetical protein